jgi:pimeloyl-ACP methyl ester carboxylesterase
VTSVLAIVAMVVVGVPLLLFLAQDRLLFFPQPLAQERRAELLRRHAHVRELRLEADGKSLHAWYVPGTPDAPLVLYFGGNAEDVSWMIDQAAARAPGIAWLLVSYRGYGGSQGAPSARNISEDALRWYDHAAALLKPSRIAVFGRSLGSGAAVHVAARRPVASVVLVTPFDSLTEVARHHYPFLPVAWMLRHRFDSVDLAPRISAPLLCIAAARDTVIPPAHARRLYEAWGGPKRFLELEGAGHNDTDGAPEFWRSVRAALTS